MIHFGERFARASLQLMQGYRRRLISTSVGTVHMLVHEGRGPLPPLVLLHGLSAAGVHYLRVTPHLAAFSRVVLPDLPGHGFSQMPPQLSGPNVLEGTYESLDAVIDRPVILAGTSLGGYVAMRYALARPEKVLGLVVAAPAGASMSAEEVQSLRARFVIKTHRDALTFVDALFARPHPFRHVVAVGLKKYFSLPQTLAVLDELRVPQLFTAEQVASLKLPMLFLWGDSERILPASNLDFFRANLPANARIEYPRGWGHSGFLDDPRGFAARLVQFAAEVSDGKVVRLQGHSRASSNLSPT